MTSTPSLAPRLIHHELVCGTRLSNRNQIETSSHGQPRLLADYGLLFDVEVRNGTLVLEDLFFSAAAARNTMLVQLWWRPAADSTTTTTDNDGGSSNAAAGRAAMQGDITSATFVPSEMRLAATPHAKGDDKVWHAVLPQPKQLSNVTPRAMLAVGPFQLPLHTNNHNDSNTQGNADDKPRRYSLLLCTNSPHGVRYYGAAHGLVERQVGEVLEEDAAMAVYMGVACGHAVWRALAGDNNNNNMQQQQQHNAETATPPHAAAATTTTTAAVAGHVVLGGNANKDNNKQACSPTDAPHGVREGHSDAHGTVATAVHVDAEATTLTEALSETVVQETHAKGLCGSLKYSILD